MLERLGIVLYRLGCVASVLCIALALFILVGMISGVLSGDWVEVMLTVGLLLFVALLSWVIGKTLRYILVGDNPKSSA